MKEAVGKEELWQQTGGRRRVRAPTRLGFYHLVPAEVQTHRADGWWWGWGGGHPKIRLRLGNGASALF